MQLHRLAALLILLFAAPVAAGDWPAFRGPNGTGIAEGETGVPIEWSAERNVKWKAPLPDAGNSSPVVVGERVFVTCAEDQGKQRHLICLDRGTGDQLWVKTVTYDKVEETHPTNPYCASTPASDGQRVVVWEGSAGTHCYDLDGNLLWSRDLGEFEHIWGYASSPVIHNGLVIQLCGPGVRTFLTALDLETGATVWEVPEPGGSNEADYYVGTWSTPVIAEIDGGPQILTGMPTRVTAHSPKSGQLLWTIGGVSSDRGDLAYASVAIGDGMAVMTGGFGGPAMAFKLGGRGDMTLPNRLWHSGWNHNNPQRIGTGVVIAGHVYLANADDRGSLECLDVTTGELKWRVPQSSDGAHWGSLIAVEKRLYVSGQKGVTRVFAANPEKYEVIAENDLGEQSNSTPAISNGEIFLRTFEHVYCIAQ